MGKTNLPAIRCETFIEAFEKAVHAAQQRVKKLESGQLEYLACSEVLQKFNLPNDGELALTENGATISVMAMPTDCFATFERMAATLGAALVERRMHTDGVPAVQLDGAWQAQAIFRFRTRRRDGSSGTCEINVHVPMAGLVDMAVETHCTTHSWETMKLVPRAAAQPAGSSEPLATPF